MTAKSTVQRRRVVRGMTPGEVRTPAVAAGGRCGQTVRVHDDAAATPTGTIWILGAAGQLGTALRSRAPDGVEIRALSSADIDLADADSVASALATLRAGDVVLNTAAYTAVDAAESDADAAWAVNAVAPGLLADATAAANAWLIHVSTDYVFGDAVAGTAAPGAVQRPMRTTPYEPGDDADSLPPATVYGASKLAGERAALAADPTATIVRTAWVYTGGPDSPDFVGTMRRLERSRDTITVVDDQKGSPTYAVDLADGLWELVAGGRRPPVAGKILHATNTGAATWYDVAREVFTLVGADPARVRPCGTDDFPRPAPRPAYSVLSPRAWEGAGLTPLRGWAAAVTAAVTSTTGSR